MAYAPVEKRRKKDIAQARPGARLDAEMVQIAGKKGNVHNLHHPHNAHNGDEDQTVADDALLHRGKTAVILYAPHNLISLMRGWKSIHMAYSFRDIYRPLRLLLRFNGALLGGLCGLLLLFAPVSRLARWGVVTADPGWTSRLAGALLIALGVYFVLAAGRTTLDTTVLITSLIAHSLIALVVLSAYLQRDLADLIWPGRITLAGIVILCLAGALLPLRYLRAEYRAY